MYSRKPSSVSTGSPEDDNSDLKLDSDSDDVAGSDSIPLANDNNSDEDDHNKVPLLAYALETLFHLLWT
jgi:hypothetical protein